MASKVLIVEDSATVRQQVAWALMQAGYEVVEAVDGQDALDRIAATPDLAMVFCDVTMPRMNGIELLTHLAQKRIIPRLPVVMLTTEGHPDLLQQAKALGARAWMVKPVREDLIVATVRKLTGGGAGVSPPLSTGR
jgi:two-component system, chemotaxis family, chemotaxis protein CheY